MRIRLVLITACLTLLVISPPAGAAVAAAVPGSAVAGWGTRIVFAPVGGSVTVLNTDYADHQLVADGAYLSKKVARESPWCASYPRRSCPVFWSDVLSLGESTAIQGLEHIESGSQYEFVCTIHRSMTGILIGI